MSNRIDRSLGVKPYSNAGGKAPAKKKWSLKVGTVLMALGLLCAGVVLYKTSDCVTGVRCAD
ncbi:hypothetical protein PP740_gp013 [Stenotrophomonas phage Philippe]|uniref:Membrane protein n=1 Tax=Stenotrophomonas phage Philippe TaxID=2859655 RepID=A0AAE7WMI0_9CAUD|nr:hypothetical protein PP740_gp013 [Stenotrophomonas phage Philippe]QYW02212.1 putative membrane protein [Stenotrophomonas phage Philippe]